MPLTNVHVSLKIPFTGIGVDGTWAPDESERKAAWEMYIELVTRVAIVELQPDEGLLREAFTSLYALFDVTRKILCAYGPTVARPKGDDGISFGHLAIFILNHLLRPFLAKWHPLLLDYESARLSDASSATHENQWGQAQQARMELEEVRETLARYADILAEVAGVPSLTKVPAR